MFVTFILEDYWFLNVNFLSFYFSESIRYKHFWLHPQSFLYTNLYHLQVKDTLTSPSLICITPISFCYFIDPSKNLYMILNWYGHLCLASNFSGKALSCFLFITMLLWFYLFILTCFVYPSSMSFYLKWNLDYKSISRRYISRVKRMRYLRTRG